MGVFGDFESFDLIEFLEELDKDEEVDVTMWEAEFTNSTLKQWHKQQTLTPYQRDKVIEILEKYSEN